MFTRKRIPVDVVKLWNLKCRTLALNKSAKRIVLFILDPMLAPWNHRYGGVIVVKIDTANFSRIVIEVDPADVLLH